MKARPTPEKQELLAKKIFDDWKDSVVDKNSKNMPSDFSFLFEALREKMVGRRIARKYVSDAICFYSPPTSTKKWVYDRLKAEGRAHSSKEEFFNSWDDLISRECRRAYFSAYPLKRNETLDSAAGFHPFSTKEEYEKYRSYADGFRDLSREDLDRLETKRNADFKDFVDRVLKVAKENGIDITEDELLGHKN